MNTNNRSISVKESVSALCDDEMHDMDLQRVLNSLSSDSDTQQIRSSYERYQLIGELMRDEPSASVFPDISAAVKRELDDRVEVVEVKASHSWWRDMATKSAVAASVAFAVVLGAQQFTGVRDNVGSTATTLAGQSQPGAVVPKGFDAPSISAQVVSANSASAQLLNDSADSADSDSILPGSHFFNSPESIREQALQQNLQRMFETRPTQIRDSAGVALTPYGQQPILIEVIESRSLVK